MSSSKPQSNQSKYQFDAVIKSVHNGIPIFEVSIASNFDSFAIQQQKTLIAFLLSQYESIPLLNNIECPAEPSVNDEVVGEVIAIILINDESGFSLEINGPDELLEGENKVVYADALHDALLELEAKFNNSKAVS
ncbi:hypothetical protein [Pseudoalteromonas prydzensis]|uniref:hypothetical protein n=1 Tax=Pseudoalteromonas prydzensis TaxID=182141 RepID=UPI003FD17BC9